MDEKSALLAKEVTSSVELSLDLKKSQPFSQPIKKIDTQREVFAGGTFVKLSDYLIMVNEINKQLAQIDININQRQKESADLGIDAETLNKIEKLIERRMEKFDKQKKDGIQQVVEKVLDILSEHIQEIFPGFNQLDEKVNKLEDKFDTQDDEVQKIKGDLEGFNDNLSQQHQELDYLKLKFGPAFNQKIESMFKAFTVIEYDMSVVKMNAQNYALKKDTLLIEQKLITFAPLNKFIEVQKKIEEFALNVDLKRTNEFCKRLQEQLLTKPETQEVEDMVTKQKNEIQNELDGKVNRAAFMAKVFKLEEKYNDEFSKTVEKIQDVISQIEGQQEQMENYQEEIYNIRQELSDKLTSRQGDDIWANFNKHASYSDLRDLYQRTMPEIAKFEEQVKLFKQEISQFHQVLSRFDQVITDKSNKSQVQDMKDEIDLKFIKKEFVEEWQKGQDDAIQQMKAMVVHLDELVRSQTKAVEKQIFTNIRRAIGQLKQEQQNGEDSTKEIANQNKLMMEMLKNKVDFEKVTALDKTKANKTDTETCLKWVELLHNMVKQIVHIYSMHLKGDIDMTGFESKTKKQNRKVELLHQALIISKWVDSYNPQNVSDQFNIDIPTERLDIALTSQNFQTSMNEIQTTQLSPNNKAVNEAILNTKSRLTLDVTNQQKKENPFAQRTQSLVSPTSTIGIQIETAGHSFGKTLRESPYRYTQKEHKNKTNLKINQKAVSSLTSPTSPIKAFGNGMTQIKFSNTLLQDSIQQTLSQDFLKTSELITNSNIMSHERLPIIQSFYKNA